MSESTLTVDVFLTAAQLRAALEDDVSRGLRATPKSIPPLWFYDENGSRLFEEITRLSEYYPTRVERAMLERHAREIAALAGADTLVELGAGACDKTRLLLDAMRADWRSRSDTVLRVDGGMVASDWMLQRLADILDAPVDRPMVLETTALGAAWLAGSGAGVWPGMEGFANSWRRQRRFEPQMGNALRQRLVAGWRDAVNRTRSV